MNITLCSAFRNSTSYLLRYFCQIAELMQALDDRGDSMNLVVGEGDSTDGTLSMLHELKGPDFDIVHLVDCTHGGTEFGSVASPERFRQLAYVGNCIWAAILPDTDAVLYVESDLIWSADTMLKLIDRLQEYTAISPMIYLRRDGYPADAWYDIWATRKDGKNFGHLRPYHTCYNAATPFLVDSTGSCMAIRGELANQLVWPDDVFVGICRNIYDLGASVWIDPTLSVIHE